MSDTLTKIKADFLQARKDKDQAKIASLSTLVGEIEGNAVMINGTKIVPEEITIATVKSFLKKIDEFLTIHGSMGFTGIEPVAVTKLYSEKELLTSYLPQQLSEEEIRNILSELDHSNMGIMMKHLKDKYTGRYDGKLASAVAKEFA